MIRFLGGIHLAITLIATTACFVIAGTILESLTDSHQYAAYFTYENPFFTALLGLFFVNILVSALRRWPFKIKHIPFLITHLGLLMILSGVIAKNLWGTQGTLAIWEGGGSHELILSNTFGVEVEEKETKNRKQFHLDELTVLSSTPHAEKRYESWIQNDKLTILGLPPIPLNQKTKVRIHGPDSKPWHVYGCKSDDVNATAKKLYEDDLSIIVINTLIKKRVKPEITDIQLDAENPLIRIKSGINQVSLDLQNLHLTNHTTPYIGSSPLTVDLKRDPLLAFIEDSSKNIHFYAFDPNGRIYKQLFPATSWSSLIVYDDGYEGYAVQAKIPFQEVMPSRTEIEAVSMGQLKLALKNAIGSLAPPLELLKQACKEDNNLFAETSVGFLQHWDLSHHWLLPKHRKLPDSLKTVFDNLSWEFIPRNELNALKWIAILFPPIEKELLKGRDLISILESRNWPMLNQLKRPEGPVKPEEIGGLLTTLAQQILSASHFLPETEFKGNNGTLFSAYLRLYGIHLSEILPEIPFEIQGAPTLESLITLNPIPQTPKQKPEENRPAIKIKYENDLISLAYNPQGEGLRWPTRSGRYLLQFGPLKQSIPYHIRVHEARQINYAQSNQPYSYECDVTIKNGHSEHLATLSMNQVLETWDGYRFYLAAISPNNPGEAHQVRIVVNHDPAKYILTYPGAIILSLGILLLFWYRKAFI